MPRCWSSRSKWTTMWRPEGSGGASDGAFDVFAQPQGREPKDQSLEMHRAARPLPEDLEAMTHQMKIRR